MYLGLCSLVNQKSFLIQAAILVLFRIMLTHSLERIFNLMCYTCINYESYNMNYRNLTREFYYFHKNYYGSVGNKRIIITEVSGIYDMFSRYFIFGAVET